jgi:hypothetical protein
MEDKTYGWTVEMQLKIHLQNKMTYREIPVIIKTESDFEVSEVPLKVRLWPE